MAVVVLVEAVVEVAVLVVDHAPSPLEEAVLVAVVLLVVVVVLVAVSSS